MNAAVHQYGDVAVLAAGDDHRLHTDIARLEIARLRQFRRVRDEDPGLLENQLHFGLKNRGVIIRPRMDPERVRRFDHKSLEGTPAAAIGAANGLHGHFSLHPYPSALRPLAAAE